MIQIAQYGMHEARFVSEMAARLAELKHLTRDFESLAAISRQGERMTVPGLHHRIFGRNRTRLQQRRNCRVILALQLVSGSKEVVSPVELRLHMNHTSGMLSGQIRLSRHLVMPGER